MSCIVFGAEHVGNTSTNSPIESLGACVGGGGISVGRSRLNAQRATYRNGTMNISG